MKPSLQKVGMRIWRTQRLVRNTGIVDDPDLWGESVSLKREGTN